MAVVLGRKGGGAGGGGAPSGAAGGDLGGTYPNPTLSVAKEAELDGKLDTSTYDANTVLKADADDTPVALTMGASTILARLAAGNIKAASVAEMITLLQAYTVGGTDVALADGGTGASTAGSARTNLGLLASSSLLPTGAIAHAFERAGRASPSSGALASQRVHLIGVFLPTGTLVTSVSFVSGSTALNIGTNQVFGLYDSARALLRSTTDDTSTAWASSTLKTLNLTSTFTTTYSGLHYLAILVNATTPPTIMALDGNSSLLINQPPILNGTSTTAVTALPANAAAITAVAGALYGYCS